MNLTDLKLSIFRMDDQRALAVILEMRNSRHTAKIVPKKRSTSKSKKTTKKQMAKDIIAGLSHEQKKALLKDLLES